MRVVVVGAGISGLSLALALREAGVQVHVFEGAAHPGGVIRSVHLPDRILELGPQRVREAPELRRVLDRLSPSARARWRGFRATETSAEDTSAGQVGIGRKGRIHPVPTSLFQGVGSPLLSLRGKLRLALEPFVPGEVGDAGEGEPPTSQAWLSRRAGREAYLALLGPLFGGLYGSDPGRMEARRALLPALREMGADRSLLAGLLARKGPGILAHPARVPLEGMAALPRAMAESLGPDVSFGVPVQGLAPRAAGGWEVRGKGGEVHPDGRADAVVLTLPPDGAASLLAPWAPDAARRLQSLHLNALAVVHLEVDPLPPGLGFQVALDEGGPLRGVSFSGHLDGSGSTAVAYLGGMRDPTFAHRSDSAIRAAAQELVKEWTGGKVRALHLWRTRMPAWDRSFRALDDLVLPPGLHLHANYVGRPGIIGRLREAERLALLLARQREGIQAQAGSASRGSPVMA